MTRRRFGVSTHLYHDQRLSRDHLLEIAAHGFETVELFATRSHFDYHDPSAIEALASWLTDAGLVLHSIHAPIVDSLKHDRWGRGFSNARRDQDARAEAVRETAAALDIARRIPTGFLVVHLGTPLSQQPRPDDNDFGAAARSVEEIHRLARPLGVRVALEVIPNALSTAPALVKAIEEDELELPDVGICMDFGHGFLMGDLTDAVETASGHLITTHVHDNHGKTDDHLMPFDGAIDWPATLMATQKIGYEGPLMLEVRNTSTPAAVLERARRARRQFDELFGT